MESLELKWNMVCLSWYAIGANVVRDELRSIELHIDANRRWEYFKHVQTK